MIKHIIGDVFESGADVILHQVNCQGVMGSGVAKQVKEKYSECFKEYYSQCKSMSSKSLLGRVYYYVSETGEIIGNLFTQDRFGYDGRCYTDYGALQECFVTVAEKFKGKRIAIPYLIGCHRGGGDWEIVYKMIEDTLQDCEVEIYEYRV